MHHSPKSMYYKTSEEDYENVMGVPKNFEVGPPIQRRKKTGLKTLRIRHFKGQKLSIRIMENCLNSKIIIESIRTQYHQRRYLEATLIDKQLSRKATLRTSQEPCNQRAALPESNLMRGTQSDIHQR